MALNSNHTFEELDGVKCSVVEKNCSASRVEFLKTILELNRYTVVIAKSPPPKAPAKPVAPPAEGASPPPAPPETFTVGVTDLSFNVMNAVYNRELKTSDRKIIDIHYWKQECSTPDETKWYWES